MKEVEIPTSLEIELVRRSNHAANRAKEIDKRYRKVGTYVPVGFEDLVINKDFYKWSKKMAFGAYTDVRDLIK